MLIKIKTRIYAAPAVKGLICHLHSDCYTSTVSNMLSRDLLSIIIVLLIVFIHTLF